MFAVSFPAADALLDKWGPLTLIAVRNVFGFLILLLVYTYFEGHKALRGLPWREGLFIGAVGFGLGSNLLLLAQSQTSAV